MKNKPLGIMIATLVVIVAIVLLVIWPVISSIWKSWKDYSQAKNNLKIIEERQQVLEDLSNNRENITKVSDIAKLYIPENQDSGQLIIELTAMAQANNIVVEETSIDKTTSKNTSEKESADTAKKSPTPATTASSNSNQNQIKNLDFTMKLTGSFKDFMNFLKAIETSSRLILINDISAQNKSSNETSNFSVELSGSAYYKSKVDLEPTLANIKISKETLDKFLNLKSYGQPIDLPSESGFGRPNPFENY